MDRLRSNKWCPLRSSHNGTRFRSYIPLEPVHLHDVYFDRENALMDQGIYVRLRNGEWEAKVRQAGGLINSQFAEFQGFDAVDGLVRRAFSASSESASLHQLNSIAEFKTERQKWDIEEFEVVVDLTDFGHTVGEVELCARVERQPEEREEDCKRNIRDVCVTMDRRIERFMGKHRQAFPPLRSGRHVEPISKLSAYFAWKKNMEEMERTSSRDGNS
ncbi:hypothetical protein K491DRAFT_613198 [Lophiostoma macrostomum CBS 122681]|uniref:CYTH domain-containing protein n=1 Tax=Lophiostoma macrostomum CBS 122681 TaxID=1314788 RepID=A0A6A6SK50_9PLEO|nr:hypothetical protein K491DRAFT_613198 [Lophiostoma macrostomum CBS 122681]